ncbi:MAG: leucine-rich repeat protein [Oscillospiraceae bacterium]|nr:leucine-rich repeat protein [Oscillospiraceae bacterium]
MKKKLLSLLLILAMLITYLPVGLIVMAADTSDFTIRILNGTYCAVTGYTGSDTAIVIPSEVNGYIVQTIDNGAFQSKTTLTSVVLPNTLETMGSNVFSGCSNLSYIGFNDGLVSIGSNAFADCRALETVQMSNTIKTIGSNAFSGCTNLENMVFSTTLTTIESYAFSGCTGLVSLTLPDSVTMMGYYVFDSCSNLTSINYPRNLASVANTYVSSSIGYVSRLFYGCTNLTNIVVPEDVTAIPAYTFSGSTNLQIIVLPSTLNSIGNNAFANCTGLSNVNFVDSLRTIGNSAFNGCTSLREVTLNEGLTSVGNSAFNGCTGMTKVSLPSTLMTVSDSTFNGCTGLTTVSLPSMLTTVGNYAFSGCTSLVSLTLPDSVTTMGYYVFDGCSNLTSINYPRSLTSVANTYVSSSIGYVSRLFYGCTKLTNIVVPEEVTTIPAYTFSGSTNLQTVVLSSTISTIGNNAFANCTGLSNVNFVDSLRTIGSNVFNGCTSLREVTLNEGLASVGNGAFNGCTGMTKVSLPNTLTTISDNTFSGCTGLTIVSLPNVLLTIGNYAFSGCTGVVSLTLPDSVTTMGYYVFDGCSNLTSINYPRSLTNVANTYVSSSVGYASRLFYGCTKLTSITVSEDVTAIPAYTFSGSTNLQTVILPSTLVTIGNNAFANCTGLEKVWIDRNAATIGNNVFLNCSQLTIHGISDTYVETYANINSIPFSTEPLVYEGVTISGKVIDTNNNEISGVSVSLYDILNGKILGTYYTDSTGTWACLNARVGYAYQVRFHHPLYKINIDTISCVASSDGNILPDILAELIAGGAVTSPSSFTTRIINGTYCAITGYTGSDIVIVIPNAINGYIVQTIDNNAFQNKTTLTSVVLPNTLETIGSNVFSGCTNLSYIGFNDGLETIGNNAFTNCRSLTMVQLSNTVKTIGSNIFSGCTGLTTVSLPNTLTTIDSYAFSGCTELVSLTLPDSVTTMGYYVFDGCSNLTNVNYPRNLTSVANTYVSSSIGYVSRLFYGCPKLTSIIVPEGVTAIPAYTFSGSANLQAVILPSTLDSIGNNAFANCTGLSNVNFVDSLRTIGNSAFNGCTSLREVTLNEGLTSLGNSAFNGCTGMTMMNLPNTLMTISDNTFSGCIRLTTVSLPSMITTIGNYAFSGCMELVSLTLPDSVTTMGYYVFDGCSNLTSINYPRSLTSVTNTYVSSSIGYVSRLFYGCPKLTSIVVPEGVTAIPAYAFSGSTSLQTVVLPNTLESIGNNAFANCTGLGNINFVDNLKTIGNSAFNGCTSLREVTLNEGLTSVGNSAFSGCTGMTKVSLPNTLMALSDSAFSGCTGLTTVSLPNILTTMGNYAFSGCTGLVSLMLPDSVTTMGYYVFDGCSNLTSINYPRSLTSVANTYVSSSIGYASRLFYGCTKLTNIVVPEGVTAIPMYTFSGSTNIQTVILPSTLDSIGNNAFANCTGLEKVWIDRNAATIGNNVFLNCSRLTIHGISDTYAETYANTNSIPFSTESLVYEGVTVSGKVVDTNNNGVSGASVSLYDTLSGKILGTYYTNSSGEWVCTNARVGYAYQVRFHHPLYKINIDTINCVASSNGNVLPDVVVELVVDGTVTLTSSFTTRIINGTYCAITGYTGSDTVIIIPKEINGYIVQSIDNNAFQNKTTLTSVVLPSTLEIMGSNVFSGCTNLSYIGFNDGLETIGNNAFTNCRSLTIVQLPNTVKTIGSSIFSGCTGLTTVSLPNTLTTIESYAFSGCTGLVSLTLPDSVTTMGYYVFDGCSNLTSINYPRSLTSVANTYVSSSIGYVSRLFYGCTKLTSITIPEGVTTTPAYTFSGSTNLQTIVLPSTLATIGNNAFNGCTSLRELFLNEGLTSVGNNVFNGCTEMTTVSLPSTLTTLNDSMFNGCISLREVIMNEGLTTIGNYAFSGCTGVVSLTLPDSVTTMGYYVFDGCSNLTSINYPRSLTSVANTYVSSSIGYVSRLFYGCTNLTSITVPEDVTAIPAYTFSGNTSLQTVVLPNTLESIGNNAFANCTGLSNINFVNSLRTIGNSTFNGCTSLSEVTLNEGLTIVGNSAFSGCTGMTTVSLPNTLTTINDSTFNGCIRLAAVNLPNALSTVNNYAFSGCTGLVSLTLPDSVTTMGYYVFDGCSNLTSINYPRSLTNVANTYVSSSIGYVSRLFYGCTKLTSITVPEGVTAIPAYTFSGSTNLQTVVLPSTLAIIGNNAFANCTGLMEINLVEGLKTISQSTFMGCSSLSVLEFPESMESIGNSAYSGCSGLRLIIFNEGLKTIGSNAFDGCAGLTSIVLNDGLTTLSSYSFASCINLTSILIPNSVTSIAANSFNNCPKLKIYCYSGSAAHYAAENNGYPYFLLDAHDHEFFTTIETSPTCTRGGSAINTCSICGYNYIEVLEPLGHTPGDWIIVKEATCIEDGLKKNYCIIDNVELESEIIPATGHTFGEWSTEKEATVLANGLKSRECEICGEKETENLPQIFIDISQTNEYGLANFTVVNATTLEPISGASIFISTPNDGECTLSTDSNGKISQVLPVGNLTISAYANGYLVRELKITIKPGIQEIPRIGLSEKPMVEGKLTVREMTYDEIIAAGIDPNAPGNQHVYRYQVEITFRAEIDVLSIIAFFNGTGDFLGGVGPDGGGGRGSDGVLWYNGGYSPGGTGGGGFGWRLSDGTDVTIFPVSERFYLIIYGEVRWLKEMFDAELLVINNSLTDTIEDCVAELTLPDGLSLADMVYGAQSAVQTIDYIEEGGSKSVHWYIRGDKEGTYSVTASLQGTMMPFDERFSYEYVAQDPIKVYAGSAMHMTFYIPDSAFEGEDYTIRIELENVSHKSLYGVSHTIYALQGQVTHYSDGTVVTEEHVISGTSASAKEFKPGDKIIIEMTTNIMFHSEMIQHELNKLIGMVDNIETLMTSLKMLNAAANALNSLGGWIDSLSSIVDSGGLSWELIEGIWGLRDILDYMEFGKGEETKFNIYDSIRFAIANIPIRFVVTNVAVTTLSGSTTEIPYTIKLIPVGARYFGVDNIGQYIYDLVIASFGEISGDVLGVPFAKDITGYQDAVKRIKVVEDNIARLNVKGTGESTSRAWIEPAATRDSRMSSFASTSSTDFILSTNNETATYIDGVLEFKGSGIIEITPLNSVGGILYIENSEGYIHTYIIDVVEPHVCHSDNWTVIVPPTENTVGYKAILCDVCGDLLKLEEMIPCGNHIFGEWVTEFQPTNNTVGIKTRTCENCGLFEYEIIDSITNLPTGEIVIGTNYWNTFWNTFWNTVTFGLIYKDTKSVSLTADSDSTDEITIQYYLSDSELTLDDLNEFTTEWINYKNSFNINPNSKIIIYVKITDEFGNVTYINSTGIVLYTDSEAVTTEINFVKGFGLDKIAEVLLNGNTIQKIMNGEVTLEDGTDYIVSDGTIKFNAEYLESLETGEYTLTVYYNPLGVDYVDADENDIPATTEITLKVLPEPIILDNIIIFSLPDKMEYIVGDNFDLAGIIITAVYSDGSEKEITDFNTSIDDGDILDTIGIKTITVSYTEDDIIKTVDFTITVNPSPIISEGINITTLPEKMEYIVGEPLELTGIVVIIAYSDGSSEEVADYTTDPVNGTILDIIGTQTIIVSYTENDVTETTSFTVVVNALPIVLESISVTTLPDKTVYTVDEELDLSGMIVTAVYSDENTKIITDFSTEPTNGTILDIVDIIVVTVSYIENEIMKTDSFTITVNAIPVILESISVTTPPIKTVYTVGEALDLTGMVVTASYSDSSYNEVTDFTSNPINGAVLNIIGTQTIIISYTEDNITETDNFNVVVNAEPDVTPPTGEISIETNYWNSFWNTVTFGLICKNTQTVTITASDKNGNPATIQYYLSDEELTLAQIQALDAEWMDYSSPFDINPKNKYIIYVKLSDSSDNVAYINSEGIVLYEDSVLITTKINYIKGSEDNISATINLNGNTIANIKNGEYSLIELTDYVVSENEIIFSASYLDTLVAGTYTLTVSYNPLGIAYPETPSDGSNAPAISSITLTVNTVPDIQKYEFNVSAGIGGNISGTPSGTYEENTEMNVTATANIGYHFKDWTVSGVAISDIIASSVSFNMPAGSVTMTANFELDSAIVTNVIVSPQDIEVQQGGTHQFGATVEGENNPEQTVIWSVSDNESDETTISDIGLLTVGLDETANTLIVTATSTIDTNKFGMATVIITSDIPTPFYGISLDVSAYTFIDNTAKTVTITNTGNQPTGELIITLNGEDSNAFIISKTSIDDIAIGEFDTFDMVPKTELTEGTYTVTVTLSGDNGISASFDVNFTVNPVIPTIFTLTINSSDGGTVSGMPSGSYAEGTPVSITATENNGYTFAGWTAIGITLSENTARSIEFTMPDNNVMLTANFTKINYIITANPATGTYTNTQSVTLSVNAANVGIYYTVNGTEPTINNILYTGAIAVNQSVTIKAVAVIDGEIVSDVATFVYTINTSSGSGDSYVPPYTPPTDGDTTGETGSGIDSDNTSDDDDSGDLEEISDKDTPLSNAKFGDEPSAEGYVNPYTDVKEDDWFAEAARIMNQLGIMIGSGNTNTFKPHDVTNRYMLATILYRLNGEPEVSEDAIIPFSDVIAGEWYSDAIIWAYETGLMNGFPDGTFKGSELLTREQIVTVFYRYAEIMGFDVSARADLSKYEDAGKISDWALEAMQWAVAVGLIVGRTETTTVPQGEATRAEIAMIMKRFLFEIFGDDEDNDV